MKSNLKNEIFWGWTVTALASASHLVLAFYHAFSKSNIIGIVNIHKLAAYAYEGSYMLMFINPIAVILFYWLFLRLVYKKITTAKKIKPLIMFIVIILISISVLFSTLLILNS